MIDGIQPIESRNGRLHAIFGHGNADGVGLEVIELVARVAAGDAHVSGEDSQHAYRGRCLLAVGMALHALALVHRARLRGGDFAGELLDGRCGDARDLARPRGRFRRLVGAVAQNIVLVRLVLPLGAIGHGRFVITDAIRVQEIVIDEVFGDHHVRHGVDHRRIGAGANGNPPVGARGRLVAVARVDDHELRVAALKRLREVVTRAAAAHLVLNGVFAKLHHQLGVLDIGIRVAVALAVDERQGARDLRRAVRAVVAQAPAIEVHEALQEVADVFRLHARRVLDEHGFGAVLVKHALVIVGDDAGGLVPRNLLELALAALAHALQRVLQAVLVVDQAANRTAAQACANLVVAVRVVARVVGFDAIHCVVFHMQTQRAAALAVHMARRPHARVPFFGFAFVGMRRELFGVRGNRAARRQRGQSARCFHESPSTHVRARQSLSAFVFTRHMFPLRCLGLRFSTARNVTRYSESTVT